MEEVVERPELPCGDAKSAATEVSGLLKFDPLAAAEQITGVSYKDVSAGEGFDNPSAALGFALAQAHAEMKRQVLTQNGDTMLQNDLARYRRIIEGYGFEQVLADTWQARDGHEETLFIFAHRKGLLLAFDTYDTDRVNGGHVYYNWRPGPGERRWDVTGSGGTRDGVWVGYHDCREALIHNLTNLEANGEFVSPWIERPFLWLLTYDEPRVEGYDFDKINAARIARLPAWVRLFLTPVTPDQSVGRESDDAAPERTTTSGSTS